MKRVDTRSKIVSAADATPFLNPDSVIVRGTFDPLLAAHASDLTAAARPGQNLVVLIETGSDPILPVRARAELVAGVRAVDYVIPLDAGESVTAPAADLVAAHEGRLQDLIEHVRRRAE